MKKLEVAKHLTDAEYTMFLETYARHNSTMGLEVRKNYTLSDIVKVERNREDTQKCLNVHYKNGDWWRYMPDRTWW